LRCIGGIRAPGLKWAGLSTKARRLAGVRGTAPEAMVLAWAATGAKAQARQAYGVAAWQEVPAIRERRVFVVRDELLNTPGPPLIAGAKELWRIVRGIAGAGKV